MIEDIVLPVTAEKDLVRLNKKAVEAMLAGNLGVLPIYMEFKEPFKRGHAQQFDFSRYGGVGLTHFEIVAPEILGPFVMSQHFHRLGSEDVSVEQLAALIVICVSQHP